MGSWERGEEEKLISHTRKSREKGGGETKEGESGTLTPSQRREEKRRERQESCVNAHWKFETFSSTLSPFSPSILLKP